MVGSTNGQVTFMSGESPAAQPCVDARKTRRSLSRLRMSRATPENLQGTRHSQRSESCLYALQIRAQVESRGVPYWRPGRSQHILCDGFRGGSELKERRLQITRVKRIADHKKKEKAAPAPPPQPDLAVSEGLHASAPPGADSQCCFMQARLTFVPFQSPRRPQPDRSVSEGRKR